MTQGLFSSLTTPLTPPTTEEDRLSWLRLYRSRRVGPVTFWRLVAEHGGVHAALEALPGVAREAGVNDYSTAGMAEAEAELRAGRRFGARLICAGESDYPRLLSLLPDAPPFLWVLGDPACLARPAVAMVGTRNCSGIGERMARALAEGLGAAGFAVVSGLARGIDAAAHQAALAHGTIAVVAGGVDIRYPRENAALQDRIARQGALVSEQPPGLEPQSRHFPPRNRIVSGLARALVVVEAAARSGSLITARDALDQGREVLAVPGHPFDGRVAGCNMLIRDGATLIRSAEDIIAAIGPADVAPRLSGIDAALADTVPEAARSIGSTTRSAAGASAAPERRRPAHGPADPVPSRAGSNGAAAPARACQATDRRPPAAAAPEDAATLAAAILSRLSVAPMPEDALIRDVGAPASAVAPALTDLELEGAITRRPGGLVALTGTGPKRAAC